MLDVKTKEPAAIMLTHAIVRLTPFGQPFGGYCVLCGKDNLSRRGVNQLCENPRQLTDDQALYQLEQELTLAGGIQ